RGSSEITADGVAGDPQLSSNPFAPETLAGKFVDPIHDIRFQHPGVLLRRSQVDICYIRLVRLRVKQVNQIGVAVVHIPSLTSVQEGVSFSVVKGVSFGVAPHLARSWWNHGVRKAPPAYARISCQHPGSGSMQQPLFHRKLMANSSSSSLLTRIRSGHPRQLCRAIPWFPIASYNQ